MATTFVVAARGLSVTARWAWAAVCLLLLLLRGIHAEVRAALYLQGGLVEFVDEVVDLVDGYLAGALFVENFEHLLVLGAVQVELVLLERLAILLLLIFSTQAKVIY